MVENDLVKRSEYVSDDNRAKIIDEGINAGYMGTILDD